MSTKDVDPFVGRGAELAQLQSILGWVRSGHPQTVLIESPAGMGKSALVECFVRGQDRIRLLRAAGDDSEARLAYGIVDQLVRAAGVSTTRLFASGVGSLPIEDPVSVGGSLLEILEDLGQTSVVVVVLEDAHWADPDSLRTVSFALRRLVSAPVMTMLTIRDEEATRMPEGLRRLATPPRGLLVRLGGLTSAAVQDLAAAGGLTDLSASTAARLLAHTGGNPAHVRALLQEVPVRQWRCSDPVLPAPRAFAERTVRRLEVCGPQARRLVEAVSILGESTPFGTAAALAGVEDPLSALDEATVVGLLETADDSGIRDVGFPSPLVRAAVRDHLGPLRRVQLHRGAADLLEDEGARLHHRVAAATAPDDGLSEQLSSFAERQRAAGAWAAAAAALLQASRLTDDPRTRRRLLLSALDVTVGSGDLSQASSLSGEIAELDAGPLGEAALGYVAVLSGRRREAETRLRDAQAGCDLTRDQRLAAVIARLWALHSVGKLDGTQIVDWTSRSLDLAPVGEPARIEAEGLLGIGCAWSGRAFHGLATYESVLARSAAPAVSRLRVQMPLGLLRLMVDDVEGARSLLAESAHVQSRRNAVRTAVWAYVWLSRSEFLLGSWDQAAASALRAVSLVEDSGHEWMRPLVRWAAGAVPAARGEWRAAEEHARLAAAQPADYELMVVPAAMARAQLAAARDDHEAVVRALQPVISVEHREGVEEPGLWPWQSFYANALVSSGRLTQAAEFLARHEKLAEARGQRSSIATLAAARGRLEAASGRPEAAEEVFRFGIGQIAGLSTPFPRALIDLASGEVLRRRGQRRAASEHLQAAYECFGELGAQPYLERCRRELNACGLNPAKRQDFDPVRLTAQELTVAQLVGSGKSNRQVAEALFVSIKTVQFHLTHIYTKLNLSSRAELIAHLHEEDPAEGRALAVRADRSPEPGGLAG